MAYLRVLMSFGGLEKAEERQTNTHTRADSQKASCVKDTAAQCDAVPPVDHALVSVCSPLVTFVVRQADEQAHR